MSLLEQVSEHAKLEQRREIKRICRKCLAVHKKQIIMQLQLENNWYMCPNCKDVQPVNSPVPLWWSHCPNTLQVKFSIKLKRFFKNLTSKKIAYTDLCLYPLLVTIEQNNTKTNCKRCNFEYLIKIGA